MPAIPWVEVPLMLLMLIGSCLILWKRLTSEKGIGSRIIQLLALFLLVPSVAVLALEGKISGESTGTIIGVIVGYTLSGVSKPLSGSN